jgi:phosphatidylserine/phosphatidylglycerophosphate/cardiolipin synthase-like enzyme
VVGCDLYGVAAENSVHVPMETAAKYGVAVRLFYRRLTRSLTENDLQPNLESLKSRGIFLERSEALHGKFLIWDDTALAVSSFNWMSAALDGTRASGAELGVLVPGPSLPLHISEKLSAESRGQIRL